VAYDTELASRIRAALAAHPGIDEKKMFGGISFMVAGQMACGVLKDDLVVRIDPARFDAAVAQPHVRPFDFTGRPMTGMVYVAAAGLTSDEVLETWVQGAVDFVNANPRPAKRARRPKTPRR
jgi:TfoX/Sxy family transcriptional regulator of competence genes